MRYQTYITVSALLLLMLVLGTCGTVVDTPPPETQMPGSIELEAAEVPSSNWSQLLSRDSIRPIYDPEFVPADESGYHDDELVMGVALEGEAKAYPVSVLNGREIVNDELGGTPILVTW